MHLPFNIHTLYKPLWLPLLALSASVISPAAQAQIPSSGSLTAEVTGLKNTNGQVCFSLFNSGEGFPNNPEAMVATQCVSAATTPTKTTESGSLERESSETMTESTTESPTVAFSVTFANLELGTYAVSVLHDENGDNQLNTGSFGIPTEGFGFSQNPVIQAGAPEFSEAAVVVAGPSSTTEIELVYY
jgi:uncharacterized protein (DUF2141 family)